MTLAVLNVQLGWGATEAILVVLLIGAVFADFDTVRKIGG